MSTIPASELVASTPSVLGVGGSAIEILGVLLTTSPQVPIGTAPRFPDQPSVAAYFGGGSLEAALATIYFNGFTISNKKPAGVYFTQYNQSSVAAYLRGGSASVLTLAQLQALAGSLTVVMDGYSHVITSISLASYNSFSAAAAGIQAAFTDPTEASFTAAIGATGLGTGASTVLTMASTTGLISVGDSVGGDVGVPAGTVIVSYGNGTGGNGTYNTNHPITSSGAPLTISSNVLNVTADTDHTIAAGQTLSGATVAANTLITGQLAGGTPGGIGHYTLSGDPQQVASEAMTGVATAPLVTYDSVSGAFVVTSGITGTPSTAAFATGTLAAPLFLTSATGAVLSQGAVPAVPATFMNALVGVTTNWATFMTCFDPDNGSGNTVKQEFSAWKQTQNNRYGYVCWDPDLSPSAAVPAASSLGQILLANGDSGTCLIGQDAVGSVTASLVDIAAFICGSAASIDFEETNGRVTFSYKEQDGLVATVSNALAANNLGGNPQSANRGNGYNFYGAYADITTFSGFQRGFCTGPFAFFDSYVNQIWLNSQLRAAGINLERNSKSIPYSVAGDTLIEQAMQDPIDAGLNFGAFGPGDISNSQAVQVNAAAGANISGVLETQGRYFQVLPASSPARAARTTPPCTLWYLDRGSVHALNIASVALQ